MKYKDSVVLFLISFLLLACSQVRDWNCMGYYEGNGIELWLKPDSTVRLISQYSPTGYGDNGKWTLDGRRVIVSFPKDTTPYDPTDITRYLIPTFDMETIVLEKTRKDHLSWRNRAVLIRINAESKH